MKTTLLLFVFILFFYQAASAQPSEKIDSLQKVLRLYTSRDTIRVDILNQIGFEYWTLDAGKSEGYGMDALTLSRHLNYYSGIGMANRVIGVSHWARGNFFSALDFLYKSDETYKKINDELGQANITMNIGMVYADQLNYERALKHYFDALSLFEKLKQQERIAIVFTKIGAIYSNQRAFEKAYEYFIKAMQIHRNIHFEFGIQDVCSYLGQMYRDQGNYKEAEKHFNESLAMAEKRKDIEHTAKNLENLSRIYLEQKRYNEAEKNLNRAYALSSKYGYKKIILNVLFGLKTLASTKKDYRQALVYFEAYELMKDSLFSKEKNQQIANLELRWQERERVQTLDQRKQQILLLQQNARVDNLTKVMLAIVLATILIVGFFIFRHQRYRIQKNHEVLLATRQLFQSRDELALLERDNTKLKENELRQQLELKNRELTSYAINFIQKNELLEELQQRIEKIKNTADPSLSKELHGLLQQLQHKYTIDRDWEDFKLTFENVHPDFVGKVLQQFPDLSPSELKLCALIRLNLGIKEKAALLGISASSTKTARYRLRKKLNLQQDQGLDEFIISLS